jgi:hypothetical protein
MPIALAVQSKTPRRSDFAESPSHATLEMSTANLASRPLLRGGSVQLRIVLRPRARSALRNLCS